MNVLRPAIIVISAVTAIIGFVMWHEPDPNRTIVSDRTDGEPTESLSADEAVAADGPALPDMEEVGPLPSIPFVNVTEQSGIRFRHNRGLSDERLLPETMGSGCAVLDLDGDGLQDVVFVNSRSWDWVNADDPASGLSAWRNRGNLQFEDVTKKAGLSQRLYGMGIAVADYDNDGDDDIYVTAVGKNCLLRNDQGRFTDVTGESGTAGEATAWSSSAGWFDYDGDGDLDLLVGNYVKWDRSLEQVVDAITFAAEARFGSPDVYPGELPCLFRNDDGVFTNVTAESGMTHDAKMLGIAFLDANADGRTDVFFANDGVPDQLYLNEEAGFRDVAVTAGVSVGQSGSPRAGMGIDIADFRNDGTVGIAIGHYENEMTGLFVSAGAGLFTDQSLPCGIGRDSLADLTWGVRWVDFDLDGRLDLITTNGHVEQSPVHLSDGATYLQPAKLYWNAGRTAPREFVPLPASAVGQDLCEASSGRSLAIADFDNDGDSDVITSSSGRSAQVFRNDVIGDTTADPPGWLQVRLVGDGRQVSADAMGAWLKLQSPEGEQRRQVFSTRGYLSSCTRLQTFGLGPSKGPLELRIVWPSGREQVIKNPPARQVLIVHELPSAAESSF